MTYVFLYAWGFVDSVDRLRDLLEKGLGSLSDETDAVLRPCRTLRNHVQHLRQRLLDPAQEQMVEWGTISWFAMNEDGSGGTIHALVPGGMAARPDIRMVSPLGRHIHGPVDMVELSAFGDTLSLSDIHRHLLVLADRLGEGLAPQFEGHGHVGADLHLRAKLAFDEDESPKDTQSS